MLLYIILKNNNVDQPGILHSLYFEKKRLTAMITKIKNGSLEFPWNYKKTPQKIDSDQPSILQFAHKILDGRVIW